MSEIEIKWHTLYYYISSRKYVIRTYFLGSYINYTGKQFPWSVMKYYCIINEFSGWGRADSSSNFFLFHLGLSIEVIQLYLRIEIGINVSYIKKLDRNKWQRHISFPFFWVVRRIRVKCDRKFFEKNNSHPFITFVVKFWSFSLSLLWVCEHF